LSNGIVSEVKVNVIYILEVDKVIHQLGKINLCRNLRKIKREKIKIKGEEVIKEEVE
jgi:hypothetical protein